MASLAILVVFIMISLWLVAAAALVASFLGFRLVGLVLGLLSVVAGAWLLCVLPYAPFLGLINLVAGGVAILKWRKK